MPRRDFKVLLGPSERTRREFLWGTLGAGGAFLIACGKMPIELADGGLFDGGPPDGGPDGGLPDGGSTDGGVADGGADGGPDGGAPCPDPFAGGVFAGTLAFTGEGTAPLNIPMGAGLDGRLYTDLSTITPDQTTTPTETFYIRTRYPDLLDPTLPWAIQVHGLVSQPRTLTLDDLTPMVAPAGNHLMECSGNGGFAHFGMLSTAEWSGIPIADVLGLVNIDPAATRVLLSGFDQYSTTSANSTPGASWVFTFQQLQDAGAFLATQINGVPLPPDHGAPIRLMVPNWYGCSCIKWLNEIILVDDTEPATAQMQEFASRTMQPGTPALAKSYLPATMDQAAMPVRIEEWQVNGKPLYKVVGIMWGGYQVTDQLAIRFNATDQYVPVDVCPAQNNNMTWTIWSHAWRPSAPGSYALQLKVLDPNIPTRRLDKGFYVRSVDVVDV